MIPVSVTVVKPAMRPTSISEHSAYYDGSQIEGEIPIAATYKGVGIHAGQGAKRVRLVKGEIDRVSKISDLMRLFAITGDCAWSPESRLFAAARCIAGLELATERREAKPDIDREDVEARTAGLDSLEWRSPVVYGTDLEDGGEPREQPLDDEE
jgi:hypothetical protein